MSKIHCASVPEVQHHLLQMTWLHTGIVSVYRLEAVDSQSLLIAASYYPVARLIEAFTPVGPEYLGLRPEKVLPETRTCLTQSGTSAGNTFFMTR